MPVALSESVLTIYMLISLIVLVPFFYRFVGMVSGAVGPFSALLLQLAVPLLLLALLIGGLSPIE